MPRCFGDREPELGSSNGQPVRAAVLRCADCDWRGTLMAAIDHVEHTEHDVTYKGYPQDFSDVLRERANRRADANRSLVGSRPRGGRQTP